MKARITCNPSHPFAKPLSKLFDSTDFFSRSTGFDITKEVDLEKFTEDTKDYDITINFSHVKALPFVQASLLSKINVYCDKNELEHKILNFGSYVGGVIVADADHYDIEKVALKYAHKKVAYSRMFHNGYLDSYLINFSFLEHTSAKLAEHYKHLNSLSIDKAIANIEFMLTHPYIKEMNVQYCQPGNHRLNDGVGLLIPAII
jgi:hypothetical protein